MSEHVHVVGVGGVMMSAIARLLLAQGCRVSGSDQQASGYTDALAAAGVTIHVGHRAGNLAPDVAWVAYSSAIGADNPELVAAAERGLPRLKRDQVLGRVVNARRGLAVAGTHGKTTTSALAATLLTEAGLDPMFLVGSVLANYGTNCGVGAGEWVVVEADEYDRAFLTLEPEVAVVTNVENDHPDVYRDLDDVVATFRAFASQVRPAGLLLLGADCRRAPSLASAAGCTVQTYGAAAGADWRVSAVADDEGLVTFRLTTPAGATLPVRTTMLGAHNALNATAAIAAAAWAGVAPARAAELVARFAGTQRRCERLIDQGGILVLDDYAHHPTEVAATIAAARRLGRRLRVVFEPHQFARTRALLSEYAGVFDQADEALICDIHRARETDTSGVSGAGLAAVAGGPERGVFYVGPHAAARERLIAGAGEREVWLVMGAGDVTHLAHELAAWVAANR